MPVRFLRRRRNLILLGICLALLIPCIAVGVAGFLGDTRLTAALTETDRLDPGWRNAEMQRPTRTKSDVVRHRTLHSSAA